MPLPKSEDERVAEWMPRTGSKSRDRAQFRPTAMQKELLVHAASLTGQTLSAFMSTAIEERAKRVIADHERIILNERSRETFFAALSCPPKPNDRLIALADRYAREVKARP